MTDTATELTSRLVEVLGTDPPADAVECMIGVQSVPVGDWRCVVVTLAAPHRHNALDLAGWRAVAGALQDVATDPAVRCVVVRGAGRKAFSAGADISEFTEKRLGDEAARSYNAALSAALAAIQSAPVPVLAMVDGLAVGGGCEMAAACDVRLASDRSSFGIPVGRLGVSLGLTETRALTAAIGAANLRYLLFSGSIVDAPTAAGMGLVQRVVAPEELVEVTAQLVGTVVTNAEATMRAAKQVTALAAADPAANEEHPLMRRLEHQVYAGADLREGVEAFLAGRPARFTDRRSTDDGRA